MKSITVPKTSIPPSMETLVIQMTPKEAKSLLEVCEVYQRVTGYSSLASIAMIKHLKEYLSRFKTTTEGKG